MPFPFSVKTEVYHVCRDILLFCIEIEFLFVLKICVSGLKARVI